MTRQEFIRKLQEALNGKLDAATIQDHLKFYDDYIIEEMRKGKSEQEVLELLGDPWAIAKTIEMQVMEQTKKWFMRTGVHLIIRTTRQRRHKTAILVMDRRMNMEQSILMVPIMSSD